VWGPRMRRGDDSKWPASLLCATRPTKCGESSEEQQVLRKAMQASPLDANQDELDLSGPAVPLCPFCGVLLQRSMPVFLLSTSPV